MRKVPVWIRAVLFSLLALVVLAGCASQSTALTENSDTGDVVLYFFWGDGCPHCASAEPVLEEWNEEYPTLNIRAYEVWYSEPNQALYAQMAEAFQVPEEGQGVPLFYLNDQYWVGWASSTEEEIESAIQQCIADASCADAGAGIMPNARTDAPVANPGEANQPAANSDSIRLLGREFNLGNQSLLVSTLLIAFVDGFNPCSLWVLSMLLALTLHTGSRKKIIIIGLVFLTVTALVYAMFIAGLFTFLTIVSFTGWIQVIVALVALFFAIVNIKDYFWYKEGISMTISDKDKPGVIQRIRRVMDASDSLWGMIGATIVLAAGVSLVEFSCTAGFPVLWTNLLTSQQAGVGLFIGLLIVYMLIYQLDELAIFLTAVFTLKASRLEEKQGRILKLIGGMLMLTLALVMLIRPSYMNSLTGSLVVFGVALALVLLVLLLHRRILPSMGIWIGSEAEGRRRTKKRTSERRVKRH